MGLGVRFCGDRPDRAAVTNTSQWSLTEPIVAVGADEIRMQGRSANPVTHSPLFDRHRIVEVPFTLAQEEQVFMRLCRPVGDRLLA